MVPGAYQFDLVCLPASSRGFPVPTFPVLGLQTHIVALFRGCWGFKRNVQTHAYVPNILPAEQSFSFPNIARYF